jgi:hypothetical protein
MTEKQIKDTLTLFRTLVLSQSLIETLDDLRDTIAFRQQVKHHAKNLHDELLKVIGDPITLLFSKDEDLMLELGKAIDELTKSFVTDPPAVIASIPAMLEAAREQFDDEIGDQVEYIKNNPIKDDKEDN